MVFIVGAGPLIVAGLGHGILTIADVFKPRQFTPTKDRVRREMRNSSLAFEDQLPFANQTDMWRAWLGFNISHSLGLVFFGSICVLLAAHDFNTVRAIGLMPIAIGACAIYAVLAIRFWFWGPLAVILTSGVCFTLALILS